MDIKKKTLLSNIRAYPWRKKPYTTLKKIVKVTKSKVSLSQERGFCFQNSNSKYQNIK